MLSARERNYLNTKKALFKALDNLKNKQPTLRELKQKLSEGKLKINPYSVEKEAGTSTGALRNHQDVTDAIKGAKFIGTESPDDGENTDTTLALLEVTEEKLKKSKHNAREQGRLKKKYYDQSKRDKEALSEQVAQQATIVKSLLEKIPKELREEAMRTIVRSKGDNVLSFK